MIRPGARAAIRKLRDGCDADDSNSYHRASAALRLASAS